MRTYIVDKGEICLPLGDKTVSLYVPFGVYDRNFITLLLQQRLDVRKHAHIHWVILRHCKTEVFLWSIEITATESNRDKNDNVTEEKVEVRLCFHGQLYC